MIDDATSVIEGLVLVVVFLPGFLLGLGAGLLLRRWRWRLIAGAAAVFIVSILSYFVLPPPEPCETCAGEEGIYGPYDAIWVLLTSERGCVSCCLRVCPDRAPTANPGGSSEPASR